LALAFRAGGSDDFSLPLAAGTGGYLHEGAQERLLLAANFTGPIALRTPDRLRSWLSSAAPALGAHFVTGNEDLFLCSKDGFLELDGEVVSQVRAPDGASR
jgi:hypothetical protein